MVELADKATNTDDHLDGVLNPDSEVATCEPPPKMVKIELIHVTVYSVLYNDCFIISFLFRF